GWGLVWQLGVGVLGCGSGNALWRLKNLLLLHDPMAPLMWHREGIETLFRDSGAQVLTATAGLAGFLAALGSALRPQLGYLLPLALASLLAVVGREASRGDAATASAGAAHEGAAARTRCRVILLAALLGLAAWAATGTLPRFLAPTLALLLALTAAVAGSRFGTASAAVSGGIVFSLGLAFTVRDPVLRQATRVF